MTQDPPLSKREKRILTEIRDHPGAAVQKSMQHPDTLRMFLRRRYIAPDPVFQEMTIATEVEDPSLELRPLPSQPVYQITVRGRAALAQG